MTIQAGDTVWVLISTALVMLMTPGLALFYGGLVQKRNVLSTLMHSLFLLGIVSVQWILFGYSIAFGPDVHGLFGNLDWFLLHNVGLAPSPTYGPTIPHQLFMLFQGMFAVITPALISGAFAERVKFKAVVLFTVLWTTFVYDPVCHWVWGGGWIGKLGALDFAGGTVVHILSGISALVFALVLGRRRKFLVEPLPPHNLPMTALGAGLLWFGWFGFNAGSALAANELAVNAMVVTHVAAASGTCAWVFAEWWLRGKPTLLGTVSGALTGLVAITPAAGYVNVPASIVIGAVAGLVCLWAVHWKMKFGYDDALDAFGVHGIGGIWGALATGLFATKLINAAGGNGVFFGNPGLLGVQGIAVAATVGYALVGTYILVKVVDALVGLRVEEEAEFTGLDISQHEENAYTLS